MKRHVFAAAFGALLIVLPIREALRADAALYTVEDLGLIDGFAPTVTGMNASGQLSGYVTGESGLPRAVRYTNEGGWQYLPGISTFYSLATGINDHGDVVGYHFGDTGFRAFRYATGPGATFVEPLTGGSMTLGLAIDAAGNVVGQSDALNGMFAFRAAPGLPAVALTTPGLTNTTACGINAAGQIAGYGANAGSQQHGFRLEADGTVTPIVPFDGGNATACAIDAAGRVGGKATAAGVFRAFTFDSGSPVNVDSFASSETSGVESVSEGVAVGWFVSLADGTPHATVTTADGSFDLNSLLSPGTGWTLDQAFAVNASGNIAGNGHLNGQPRAFRLTRVAGSEDTTAPTISSLSASPSTIALPNNAMVTVDVTAVASDDKDPAPVCTITGIDGHGAPATDYSVLGALTGWVRARGGATYSFAVSCADAAGNAATGSVDVVVLRDTTAPVIKSVSATPSTVWPPNGALVPVNVTVSATDNVDASPVCALSAINAVPAAGPDDFATTGPLSAKVRALGGRTYTLVVNCRDAAGNQSSSGVAVVVPPDTKAPVIASVSATPSVIWPPNSKMVNVQVSISATDNVDAQPQCSIKSVLGNAGPASDAVVTGAYSASVRAEKDRVYTVKVTCRDAAGNASWASTTVVISKDSATAAKTAQAHKLALARGLLKALAKKAAAKKAALKKAPVHFSRGSSR